MTRTRSTGQSRAAAAATEPKAEPKTEPAPDATPAESPEPSQTDAAIEAQAQAQAEAAAAQAEAEAEAKAALAAADPTIPEVKPEAPFGADPEDGAAEGDEDEDEAVSPNLASVIYTGTRVPEGTRADPGASAVTVIVPADHAEWTPDGVVTDGNSYTLHRGRVAQVDVDDADWLIAHPVYLIEAVD